ncbi:alginate lyase family protein [Joostella sp. CR20]|uniref:alginate lyase family protein n=1 Tax=Joostella sp. CR20 TaxID=2804312 RepID=UPI00313EE778
MKSFSKILSLLFFFGVSAVVSAQFTTNTHPSLTLTEQGVASIKKNLGSVPLFDETLAEVKHQVDKEIMSGIEVPIPKDMAGGYTHERHKQNFFVLQKAGSLYQILGDKKYATYIKNMLDAYAKMYKTLPLHPEERSYARGKLFWQCLNDANWLVYVSQAYDAIYDFLSAEERNYLEQELFIPFADFLSLENPKFFNRIHNHSTWGNAAVGMIGLAMRDTTLVNRALYGMKTSSLDLTEKDNDGGFIFDAEGKAGFLANLEDAFSPSGYYTEGPYYQRYAMYPFMIFAEGLYNTGYKKDIFQFKDSVLIKAVNTLVDLTDVEGNFYPLNDAQKGMSYYSSSLISAVDIAYFYGAKNSSLLAIAEKQQAVTLNDAGLAVAQAVSRGDFEKSIPRNSFEIQDGTNGNQGGITVLRSSASAIPLDVVFKYSSHGGSHGHYDKLSFSMYDGATEVLQDYGLARFVNIDQKNGGGYLKENTTWAKQTIAHNTIVQDEKSHFNGEYKIGSQHHSSKYFSDFKNKNIQIASAVDSNAYKGTLLHRTLALVTLEAFENPILIDVFRVEAQTKHQYDLPYHFTGQVISTNVDLNTSNTLSALGTSDGYQHLYKEAWGTVSKEIAQLTWLLSGCFYSLTTTAESGDELLFTRLGANDANFNLRRDPAVILRRKNTDKTTFVSVVEKHGSYSPVTENAKNAFSQVEQINVLQSDEQYTVVEVEYLQQNLILFIANANTSEDKIHNLNVHGKTYTWSGPYHFINNQKK